jgi:polar amino acid transport system substrate-binding protein
MKRRDFINTIATLVPATLITSCNRIGESSAPAAKFGASVFDRVMKSGKIRCGYVVYPPHCCKDPNTGELSGIFVDAVKRVGENLQVKIEWCEEVGWGSMIEGLLNDRYDTVASGVWANSTRAKLVDFTEPLYYSGIGVYVRPDDNRFTDDLTAINDAKVRISTIDGEMSSIIAKVQFPLAQQVSLPQLTDNSQLLLNITSGKADVTFVELAIAHDFLRSNPGSLKNIAEQKPARIFGNTALVKRGEIEFKHMIDCAFDELINSSQVDDLLKKYQPFPGAFYPVAYPYRSETVPA